jgi:nuclear pore complex protein Nup93
MYLLTCTSHYLLAASGVSVAGALRDLNNFSAQAGAAIPSSNGALSDTDIEGFVSNLQSQTTLDMIQEGLDQSKRDFDTFLEENVQMNWDAQRRRIYEHFGLVKPSEPLGESTSSAFGASERDRGAFGRSSRRGQGLGASTAGMSFGPGGMSKSVLGTSVMRGSTRGNSFTDLPDKVTSGSLNSGIEDRHQRDKQEKYAEKIRQLNGSRNAERCYPVLHNFIEVEQEVGIDSTPALINSYEAIISVTQEPGQERAFSDQDAVRERSFIKQYLQDDHKSPLSMEMRNNIINGSRTCLENLFLKKVMAALDKDPRVAQVGGIPDPKSRIRGYIRILDDRKELGDATRLQRMKSPSQIDEGEGVKIIEHDDYCWVFIYYLLRCGLVSEAASYVSQNSKAMKNMDRNFLRYIEDYASNEDRRLKPEYRTLINNEYHGRLKVSPEDSLDPYRMACYKIIGRCDLSRKVLDGIRTDEEDWLWLQFSLAREVNKNEEMADEVFGLAEIRATMADIGKRHFSQASDNPGGFSLFFFMQILAGMYEQAIAWLYPHNHIAAVHFAIALDYYGLLRVADLNTTELCKLTLVCLFFTSTNIYKYHIPHASSHDYTLVSLSATIQATSALANQKQLRIISH